MRLSLSPAKVTGALMEHSCSSISYKCICILLLIIAGSLLLIYLIITTVLMLLFLSPLFLVYLGWDLQCFARHCLLQSLGLTLRGSRESYIKGVLSLAVCVTDLSEVLVGWLLATNRNVGSCELSKSVWFSQVHFDIFAL